MVELSGLEGALVGFCTTWDANTQVERLVYSGELVLRILIQRDGMELQDALEWVDYNIENAYVGPSTPILVWNYGREDEH